MSDLIVSFLSSGWLAPDAVRLLLSLPMVADVLVVIAVFLWLFWGLYVLVMGVYRAHLAKRLTRVGYVFGLPWVAVGYLVDVLGNVVLASILFLELPREWLVTDRLQRYVALGPKAVGQWRYRIAIWLCETELDYLDPTGDHC